MYVYVDGSYNKNTGYYGWAYLGINSYNYEESDKGSDNKYSSGYQVAGELLATMKAIEHFYNDGERELVICHDYIGIANWANQLWKANKPYTQAYVRFIRKYRKLGMKILFCKVKAHSIDEYNNRVDRLAKIACGVK